MYLFTKPISSEIEISSDLNGLQPLLQRLDRLIQQAISSLQTRKETEENLKRSWLAKSEISSEEISTTIRSDSLVAWLQNTFNLSTFDLDILAIAIAPELDRSYERVYAYLQDDITNTRSDRVSNTLYLKADVQTTLLAIVKEDWQKQQPLLLYFQGSDRISKRRTAQIIAKNRECLLLIADLAKLLEDKNNFQQQIQLLWREAWFFERLLYLDNFDLLYLQEHEILYRSFLAELEKNRGITILAGVQNWIPTATSIRGVMTIPFTMLESSQRRECWQTHLKEAQIEIEDRDLDMLSDRFVLTPDQIADAVTTAYNTIRWRSLTQESEKLRSLFLHLCSAARAQSGHDLAVLARKIEPKYTWDDIVLHPNQIRQLQDICKEAEYRELVHQKWGFSAKLSLGKGINVLFSGSPGTGKTMAAEIIAHHLQLDLYKIDLSQIVSKYIGETEKNLNRIFNAATNSNAILFFDEADALFGKRSEVQDARDRYANIEVGYLLQKIEEYEGIAILTTNLRDNIDKAFERRLRFIINFNLPDAQNRYLIWQKIFPENAPCSADLDLKFLAQNFELTGANIRHIALTAAFLAADNSGVIDMNRIIQALQREYQKMGQVLRTRDLG
jgi:ATP-dependent 26S proteasome regulatory subunit